MLLGADSSIVNWPFGNPAQLFMMVSGLIIGIIGLLKIKKGLELTIFGSLLLYVGGRAININLISSLFLGGQPYLKETLVHNTPGLIIIFIGLIMTILGVAQKSEHPQ